MARQQHFFVSFFGAQTLMEDRMGNMRNKTGDVSIEMTFFLFTDRCTCCIIKYVRGVGSPIAVFVDCRKAKGHN